MQNPSKLRASRHVGHPADAVSYNQVLGDFPVIANYTSTMQRKRLLRWALAVYAVVFGLMLVTPNSPDALRRRDFDRAFFAWLHDPTPQNEATLRREELKNDIIRLGMYTFVSSVAVAVIFGPYFAGVLIWRRTQRWRRQSANTNNVLNC
jgi:hypothetical protein